MLLTRPPLAPRREPVRLACVKHAASVCPEPGSNSPNKDAETYHIGSKQSLLDVQMNTIPCSKELTSSWFLFVDCLSTLQLLRFVLVCFASRLFRRAKPIVPNPPGVVKVISELFEANWNIRFEVREQTKNRRFGHRRGKIEGYS